VGDVLAYVSGGNNLAFITGRVSSTEFTVWDRNGGNPAAAPALTEEAGLEDPSAVRDEQVTRPEELREVAEAVVRDASRRAVQREEARCVSLREGLLRDEVGREGEVVSLDVVVGVRRTRRGRGAGQKSFFCGPPGTEEGAARPRCS